MSFDGESYSNLIGPWAPGGATAVTMIVEPLGPTTNDDLYSYPNSPPTIFAEGSGFPVAPILDLELFGF